MFKQAWPAVVENEFPIDITTSALTTTSGSTVVVGVAINNFKTIADGDVTDNYSNVYTRIGNVATPANSYTLALFWCQNIVGGAGHTLRFQRGDSSFGLIGAVELSAMKSVSFDVSVMADAVAAATTFDTGNATTTAKDTIVGAFLLDLTGTWVAGAGYTSRVEWNTNFFFLMETKDGAAVGTNNATASNGTSTGYCAVLAAFKEVEVNDVEERRGRFGFSPTRFPGKRRFRQTQQAPTLNDANLPAVVDDFDGMNRSRFGWSPSRRPMSRRGLRATPAAAVVVTAGTLFVQSIDGTLTSVGTLTKQTAKIAAGTLTSSGALLKMAGKILAGTLTSAGSLLKQTNKILAGTMTSSGALAAAKVALKSIAGTLTSSGSLLKQTNKILAGTMTSSGALIKLTAKTFAGTLTSSGTVTMIKVVLKSIAGTLTSAGSLLNRTNKTLTGAIGPTGTLTKLTAKTFAGTLTSSGALAAIRTVLKAIAGTLTSAGTVARRCGKGVTGTLTTAGLLGKKFTQAIAGTLTSAGGLIATLAGFVLQALSVVATRGRIYTVATKVRTFLIRSRGRTKMNYTQVFEKQTNEKIPKGIDYVGRLPTGATVQSVAVSAAIMPDLTDAAATVLEGIASVTTTRVTQMLKAGADGKDYRITFLTTLSDGTQLEDDLLMQVRNI